MQSFKIMEEKCMKQWEKLGLLLSHGHISFQSHELSFLSAELLE